jgi:hypothetical protein
MKNELLIVTCTEAKTDKEFSQKPLYASLQKQFESNSNVSFYIFKDNKRGLSECYNEILQNQTNINKTVLFVHDDVVLDDIFLYEKLTQSPYSITGLAGAKTFNKRADKLAWHLASDRTDYVGEVTHFHEGKIWTTVFGPTHSRALTIDGLFISCKVNDLKQKELLFDTNFNFHFYDIAFCLRANEKKVSCGVLPIKATHYGIGDSMLTPQWEEANIEFKQIYA